MSTSRTRSLKCSVMSLAPLSTPTTLGIFSGGPGPSWFNSSMLGAFQEHRTLTDGGLLVNGTICHVIVFSRVMLQTG